MAGGTSIGRMFVELGLKDANFSQGLKGAEQGVAGLQEKGGRLGAALDGVVKRGFMAATAAAVGFATAAVMVGQEFQQSLTKVAAIAGATGSEFQALEDKARQLGASTQYTASQAAIAMGDFARAGMDVNEIVAASGPAMLLAGSAGADMAQSTALMASTMAQFTLDAGEATRISDVFSTALRRSLFDMGSLTEAMKYAGTVGASFGMTLEETTASVAMFRNLGLEGSMAGTNLRMALAAAAKPTAKAGAALKKYGLEIRDINPELNSFAEIMQTVGDAGITTTDALQVFGTRAGANVATIARQFADGSTDFHNLLGELENSAGSTADLYEAMGQTVQYQARVAMSALQELLLSTFDTFKAPLQDLMAEIATTIQYVAQVFNDQSGSIGNSFDDTIGKAITYLQENRHEIATSFVGMVRGASEAISTLGQMLPLLLSIGKAMVLLWVANSVRAFTAAVVGTITQLWALRGSIHGVMVSLTAATGGIYALVAAIGTALAVLAVWVSGMREAEQAAENLRAAEEQLEADRAARDAKAAERAAALQSGMALRLGSIMAELEADDQLTAALERQLTALQDLDAEQVAAGLASGELFEVMLNGQQVVLDHATALELQWESTTLATDATKGLEQAEHNSRVEQGKVREELEALTEQMDRYSGMTEGSGSATLFFNEQLSGYGDTIDAVRAKQTMLAETLEGLEAVEDGLVAGRKKALQELTRKETVLAKAADRTGEADKRAAAAAREREKAERELQKALEKRAGVVEGLQDTHAALYMTDEQAAAASYEKRLDALQATFNTERAAREKLGEDTLELDREQAQAEALLWNTHQKQLADQRAQEELAAAKQRAAQVNALLAEEARAGANTLEGIELDRLAALEAAEGAGAEDVAAINAVFDARRARARKTLSDRVTDTTSDENAEVVRLTRERDALLAELDTSMVEERAAIMAHYGEAITQATGDAADDGEDNSGRLGAALRKVGDTALAVGRKVADAMKGVVSGIGGLLVGITGFSFSLFDAVSDVNDQLQKAAELQEELASGEIDQQQYDKAMADLPATAEEGAQAFVDELLGGVLAMVDTFVAAAPVFVTELAAAVPAALASLLAAIPQIVSSLVASVPTLVGAVAEALPALVATLVAQLPALVDALVAQLPVVIDALTEAIPVLVAGVDEAVVRVLAAIPGIVEKLLEQLPTIITAVVASVQTVVGALVEAIPVLLQVLIEQLPTITMALLDGVLSLVGTVITEVVGKLVPALVGMLPELVQMLLSLVLSTVQELVAQLPVLVEALLLAVTDVVVALVEMLPVLLTAVVSMVPKIISAVIDLIPAVILGIANALPAIMGALMDLLPTLIVALVTELIPALLLSIPALTKALAIELPLALAGALVEMGAAIADAIWVGLQKLVQFFKDVIAEIVSLGAKKTESFGDTPGAVLAGAGGMTARFAPGDSIIAAQDPMELLRQALDAVQGGLAGALAGSTVRPASMSIPGLDAVGVAMLQAADAMTGAGPGAQGGAQGGSWSVTLEADGQVLDSVLYRAGTRGKAPQLERRARKATVQAGVHPGFQRGNYQK